MKHYPKGYHLKKETPAQEASFLEDLLVGGPFVDLTSQPPGLPDLACCFNFSPICFFFIVPFNQPKLTFCRGSTFGPVLSSLRNFSIENEQSRPPAPCLRIDQSQDAHFEAGSAICSAPEAPGFGTREPNPRMGWGTFRTKEGLILGEKCGSI